MYSTSVQKASNKKLTDVWRELDGFASEWVGRPARVKSLVAGFDGFDEQFLSHVRRHIPRWKAFNYQSVPPKSHTGGYIDKA